MKTNFPLWHNTPLIRRSESSRRGRKRNLVIVVLIGGVIAFGMNIPPVRSAVTSVVMTTAQPVFAAAGFFTAGTDTVSAVFADKKELVARQEELERTIAQLRTRLSMQDIIRRENRDLKRLLGRGADERPAVLAAVLAKPAETPYDSLLIDVGTNHGIAEGDLVIAHGEVAIGRVETTSGMTARVRLFSAPRSSVSVSIGPEQVPATAQGAGGGDFAVRLPRGAAITEGMSVVFPGITPRLAGVVGAIEEAPNDAFQTIRFKLPVNIYELNRVEVIAGQGRDD